MKILCNNGNSVERFYCRIARASVTRTLDPQGNQVGDSQYDGNKVSAKWSLDMLIKENGGRTTKKK
jgi:hypothetical protein